MKTLLRVGVLTAAVAALALGSVTGAGAGIAVLGNVTVTPDPVEVGGIVTIANAPDDESLCEQGDGADVLVFGWAYSLDNDFEVYFETVPDEDGSWSTQVTIPNDDAAIGTWVAEVTCGHQGEVVNNSFGPFWYPDTEFEVVGAADPIVPDDDVAPAEEVVTAPRFTG